MGSGRATAHRAHADGRAALEKLTTWPAMIRTPILKYGARSKWLMRHRSAAAPPRAHRRRSLRPAHPRRGSRSRKHGQAKLTHVPWAARLEHGSAARAIRRMTAGTRELTRLTETRDSRSTAVNVNGRRYTVNLPDDTPSPVGAPRRAGPHRTSSATAWRTVRRLHRARRRPGGARLHDAARAVANSKVTTIEAIGGDKVGRAVQAAWVEMGVPQCGYCQSGRSWQRPRCSSAPTSRPTPRSTRP